MEVDGLVKLMEADRNAALARASIANTMADVATKYANLHLIKEQVIKARLDNIAKYLGISWDIAAHKDLIKTRNQARQKAKQLDQQAKIAGVKVEGLSTVLSGGAPASRIREGWSGFQFFRERVSGFAIAAIGKIKMPKSIYDPKHWYAPAKKQVKAIGEAQQDFGGLVDWARAGNYIPKLPSPPWKVFAEYVEAINEAAGKLAAARKAEAEAAEKDARELAKEDWARLKKADTNK